MNAFCLPSKSYSILWISSFKDMNRIALISDSPKTYFILLSSEEYLADEAQVLKSR